MISFQNVSKQQPYKELKKYYDQAYHAKQQNIEAIVISSYSKENEEVDSRFVNLKIIDNKEFIFFSNYDSPKAKQFKEHSQISAIFFWSSINVQIRMKAQIKRTSFSYSKQYFQKRSKYKNALAISSNQSKPIDSLSSIKKNYQNVLSKEDLYKCPNYWGGYSFLPFYFEFWKGHKHRLNQRELYILNKNKWIRSILQP